MPIGPEAGNSDEYPIWFVSRQKLGSELWAFIDYRDQSRERSWYCKHIHDDDSCDDDGGDSSASLSYNDGGDSAFRLSTKVYGRPLETYKLFQEILHPSIFLSLL
jgi:hypothetical protein